MSQQTDGALSDNSFDHSEYQSYKILLSLK